MNPRANIARPKANLTPLPPVRKDFSVTLWYRVGTQGYFQHDTRTLTGLDVFEVAQKWAQELGLMDRDWRSKPHWTKCSPPFVFRENR